MYVNVVSDITDHEEEGDRILCDLPGAPDQMVSQLRLQIRRAVLVYQVVNVGAVFSPGIGISCVLLLCNQVRFEINISFDVFDGLDILRGAVGTEPFTGHDLRVG